MPEGGQETIEHKWNRVHQAGNVIIALFDAVANGKHMEERISLRDLI